MAFFNYSKRQSVQDPGAELKFTSPSLINPLYKPKTLSEIKAEIDHTGINPWSHIPMRTPIPDTPGVDPMDMPAVDLGLDVFESMRKADTLLHRLEKADKDYRESMPAKDDKVVQTKSDVSQE